MSKPNIDLALAAANPVTDAAVQAIELDAAERDLLAAIALELRSDPAPGPAAMTRRKRRSGSGPAIVVFAALALAGGALAATGVWNPFGGEHHHAQQQGRPAKRSGVQPGLAHGQPGPPRQPRGMRLSPTALGPGVGTVATPSVVSPVLPQGVEEPGTDGVGTDSPPNIAGADPTVPGAGHVGDAQQVDPNGQPSGGPNGGPNGGPPQPPNPPPPAPLPSRISVFCGSETESTGETPGTIVCDARVTGAASAPTGQVVFDDPGPGRFSVTTCVLSDDGNGVSSSCAVEYAPAQPAHEASAHYGGDGANAPSSTGFSV